MNFNLLSTDGLVASIIIIVVEIISVIIIG